MKLIPRIYPNHAKIIKLIGKQQTFGVINLSNINADLLQIKNSNRKIVNMNDIFIHFPLYDNFFVMKMQRSNGWTLKQLFEDIYTAGLCAFTYDHQVNPQRYHNWNYASEIVDEYAITSGDLSQVGNHIYVNVQH